MCSQVGLLFSHDMGIMECSVKLHRLVVIGEPLLISSAMLKRRSLVQVVISVYGTACSCLVNSLSTSAFVSGLELFSLYKKLTPQNDLPTYTDGSGMRGMRVIW